MKAAQHAETAHATSGTAGSACFTLRDARGEIGAFVGQKKLSLTSDVYTHVLSDGREVDYGSILVHAPVHA